MLMLVFMLLSLYVVVWIRVVCVGVDVVLVFMLASMFMPLLTSLLVLVFVVLMSVVLLIFCWC